MKSSTGIASLPLFIAALMAIVIAGAGGLLIYMGTQNQQEQTASSGTGEETDAKTEPSVMPGWYTYRAHPHGFTVQYPSTLGAGDLAPNSVLGTYDEPQAGIFIGPLVFIVLDTPSAQQEANEYLERFRLEQAYFAKNGPPPCDGDEICRSSPVCSIEQLSPQIEFFSCAGEGGKGTYAYIKGSDYDIFVDGYSEGYVLNTIVDRGDLSVEETKAVLSSFGF